MTSDATIIIPAHNRRATTLACLRRLARDGTFGWAHVIVVDDASTDGTAAAIAADFPQVELLSGTGELWWTGAISLGMAVALRHGPKYLYWLNDDCAPAPQALRRLCEVAAERGAMTGGTCVLPGSDVVVYGGLRRRGFAFDLLPLRPGVIEPCDALSGNLVCLPAALAQEIGLPDARRLPHAIGDLDYAMRAAAAGWPVLVVHDAVAEAIPNTWDNHASWLLSDIPVADIWRNAWRKRSYGYFPTQWFFFTRHWGWRGAVQAIWLLAKRGPIMCVRLIVPQTWLRRTFGHRSQAWKEEQRLRAALASVSSTISPPAPPAAHGFSSPTGREKD
ncbi:MAG: glycosyltransferase family 2 protein [Verrucomicrobia bacterium]|nr:glycosyltransferase family 2 protein [Verrucomicrobiota bacterium]